MTDILESIQNFDCYLWAFNPSEPQSAELQDTEKLYKLSQSYKLGALIYGRRILDALMNDTTSQDNLVGALIDVIGELKDDEMLFKCILWPMFIAGLECQSQSQRYFLISCLEKFWIDTYCINVVNASRILQEHWARQDRKEVSLSQWTFHIGHLSRDWLLI